VSLVYYKALAALIILASSLAAVIFPIKKHLSAKDAEPLELGEAFASGIFLGVAFFHMLPASIASFNRLLGQVHYPIAELICVLGFITLLFLERLSLVAIKQHRAVTIPYILATILIIHSLIEGMALGINAAAAQTFLIFIAIIAHKGSASFALCVTLIRHKIPLRRILSIVCIFSLVTPVGIALGTTLDSLSYLFGGQLLEAIFNAFATGSFFYMATLHHVRFHQREDEGQGLWEFFFLVVGLATMGLVAIWA